MQRFFLLILCMTIVGIVFDFLVVLAEKRKWTGWWHATSIELLTIPFEVIPEAAITIWYAAWIAETIDGISGKMRIAKSVAGPGVFSPARIGRQIHKMIRRYHAMYHH